MLDAHTLVFICGGATAGSMTPGVPSPSGFFGGASVCFAVNAAITATVAAVSTVAAASATVVAVTAIAVLLLPLTLPAPSDLAHLLLDVLLLVPLSLSLLSMLMAPFDLACLLQDVLLLVLLPLP